MCALYVYALYVCLICVPYIKASLLIKLTDKLKSDLVRKKTQRVRLVCVPYTCALYVRLMRTPYMCALYVCLIRMSYAYALCVRLKRVP